MQNKLFFILFVLAIIYTVVNSLTDSEQKAVVECINKYRSLLANGKVKNKLGGYFPKGMDILEISYSKVVESSAKSWASNCTFDHSGGGGGYGENLYLDGDYNHKNITAILVDACNAWWGESTTDGVPTSWLTNFLGDNDEDQFEKCGHLTQMAWAKTSQIGCALKVCHTEQAPGNYVVCRYNPFGNCEGEPIYKKGQPASGCGSAGKSSNYSGLCKP